MRGCTVPAHLVTTHARPRIDFLTGVPPFARLKCVQSGEKCAHPTGLPFVALYGSTSNIFSL